MEMASLLANTLPKRRGLRPYTEPEYGEQTTSPVLPRSVRSTKSNVAMYGGAQGEAELIWSAIMER